MIEEDFLRERILLKYWSKHSEEYYRLLQKIQSQMTAFLFRNYSEELSFSTLLISGTSTFISSLDNDFPFIKL